MHGQGQLNRFTCVGDEDGELRSPLGGLFRDLETPTGESSLEESLCEIMQQHPQPDELAVAIKTALKKGRKVKEFPHMSVNKKAAVSLYTMDFPAREESPYFLMNKALQSKRRESVKPWRRYLWLLLHALRDIPPSDVKSVSRGFKKPASELGVQTTKGEEIIWHAVTSTTIEIEVMQEFLGQSGDRTLFQIQLLPGFARDVRAFSLFPSEKEVIVPPNMEFTVESLWPTGNGLTMVQLQQIESDEPLIDWGADVKAATAPPLPPHRPPGTSTPSRAPQFGLQPQSRPPPQQHQQHYNQQHYNQQHQQQFQHQNAQQMTGPPLFGGPPSGPPQPGPPPPGPPPRQHQQHFNQQHQQQFQHQGGQQLQPGEKCSLYTRECNGSSSGVMFDIKAGDTPLILHALETETGWSVFGEFRARNITVFAAQGGFRAHTENLSSPSGRVSKEQGGWSAVGKAIFSEKSVQTLISLDSPVFVPAGGTLGIYIYTPDSAYGVAFNRLDLSPVHGNGISVQPGTVSKGNSKDAFSAVVANPEAGGGVFFGGSLKYELVSETMFQHRQQEQQQRRSSFNGKRYTLETGRSSGWGSHGYGFMFDIKAGSRPLMLHSVETHSRSSAGCHATLYTSPGGFDGKISDKYAWTASGDIQFGPKKQPGRIPVQIHVPAHSTLGIYLHSPKGNSAIGFHTDILTPVEGKGLTIRQGLVKNATTDTDAQHTTAKQQEEDPFSRQATLLGMPLNSKCMLAGSVEYELL
jgi:hypothetical protein